MKTTVVFVLLTFCALPALSLAEEAIQSKPSGTLSPAEEFSPTDGTKTTPTTTKPTPANTTTTATTKPTPANTTTTATTKPTPANTTTTATTKPTPANTTTTATTTKPTPANTTTTATTTKPTPANTTTTATTTKPTPANTTTTATTTTQTTPSTTTTTGPPTPPAVGNYTLKDKDNKLCLMAVMALEIRNDKINTSFTLQPKQTKVEGICNDTRANLTLVFKEGIITFFFNKSIPDNNVYVDSLSFNILVTANKQFSASNTSLHLFPAKIGHSYSCKKESLYMGNDLYLDLSQDRMQAFNMTNSEFGRSDACPADQPNYSIAIGVGVALLILIVIVLVVYFVSRRKRTNGYQSL